MNKCRLPLLRCKLWLIWYAHLIVKGNRTPSKYNSLPKASKHTPRRTNFIGKEWNQVHNNSFYFLYIKDHFKEI